MENFFPLNSKEAIMAKVGNSIIKDIVTYDLVSQILADEVEHEEDLQSVYEDISEFIEQIKG